MAPESLSQDAILTGKDAFVRVIAVDDDADIRNFYERYLKMLGHEVHCFGDGREAISAAKLLLPDVILSDICMPGLDGWTVAEQLRADPATAELRLVAISALAGLYDQQRSRQAGFNAHFCKPVSPAQWPAILFGSLNQPSSSPPSRFSGRPNRMEARQSPHRLI